MEYRKRLRRKWVRRHCERSEAIQKPRVSRVFLVRLPHRTIAMRAWIASLRSQ